MFWQCSNKYYYYNFLIFDYFSINKLVGGCAFISFTKVGSSVTIRYSKFQQNTGSIGAVLYLHHTTGLIGLIYCTFNENVAKIYANEYQGKALGAAISFNCYGTSLIESHSNYYFSLS